MFAGETWRPYQPQLSIILPTYNRMRYLSTSVESALANELELELLIVDDGSTDGTAAYVASLTDPRVIALHQENRGEYVATNLGLRAAAGDFVTWVHSDDVLPIDSLSRRMDLLITRPDIDLVHGDIEFIDVSGDQIGFRTGVDQQAVESLLDFVQAHADESYVYPMHHSSTMFRRSLLSRVGFFDESLPTSGDLDWTVRALMVATIAKAEGTLYRYRQHDDTKRSADKAVWDRTEINQRIYDKHADAIVAQKARR